MRFQCSVFPAAASLQQISDSLSVFPDTRNLTPKIAEMLSLRVFLRPLLGLGTGLAFSLQHRN